MLAAPREAVGLLESAREFVVTRYGEIELNITGKTPLL